MPILDKNIKILVVDDDPSARLTVINILEEMEFENIFESFDGKDAYSKIKQEQSSGDPFQIIFSDWQMPEMSGIELLKTIREDESLKGLIVILVTALNEKKFMLQAIELGVDSYITKPVDPKLIKERLKLAAQRRGLEVAVTV
ncbi:MAG: response regulator [Bdellovibrionales bacterium]